MAREKDKHLDIFEKKHMNFLAHFYLAFGNEDHLVGQFIADAVKGNKHETYTTEVQNGIKLHRKVDSFTDTFPALLALRAEIRPHTGLLSPIVLDLLMDHQLAKFWHDYNTLDLDKFATLTYESLNKRKEIFPERMQYTLEFMTKHDWLSNYANVEGISRSITGLSKRVTRGEQMLAILPYLESLDQRLNEVFRELFPALVKAVKEDLPSTNQSYLSINHYLL